MVARSERAHFVGCRCFLPASDTALGLRAGDAAAFLDAFEILRLSIAARHRPTRAALEHLVHFARIERDRAGAADAGRNVAVERVGERLLDRQNFGDRKAGEQRAHAAGNIETDAARRDDAALLGIEGRDAADRKAVAPMRVRHDIASFDDAGQGSDIGGLFADFVVHVTEQRLVGEDDRRHAHRAGRLDTPSRVVEPGHIDRGSWPISPVRRRRRSPPTRFRSLSAATFNAA